MSCGLAKRDDVQIVSPLCVGHVHDLSGQQTNEIDPLLAIDQTVVFLSDDRSVEDTVAANKVEPVIFDVASALRFVPGHHALSVPTKNVGGHRKVRLRNVSRNIPEAWQQA